MSQCVPSWDVDDNRDHNSNVGRLKINLRASSNSVFSNMDVPKLDYEVAELTWKNGQVAMHGLGPPRVVNKLHAATAAFSKYTWEKPRAAETLEEIVNQATFLPYGKSQMEFYADDLVPWLENQTSNLATGSASASVTMAMDALVPSSNTHLQTLRSAANGSVVPGSTRVASCSGDQSGFMDQRVARSGAAAAAHEWSSCKDQSVSGSATFAGMESGLQMTVETCEREFGGKAFTYTSTGSPENTTSGKRSTESTSPDDNDSVGHSKRQKVSNTEERKKGKGKGKSSERKRRRDKINQKMKTLQKLVPNANKTDKASMLEEVIEYLKQLQAQIHMMSRMNMSPMMMPLAMQQQQQQLQMAMMNPMGMGMGMGMGIGMGMGMGMGMPGVMDLNSIGANRSNIPGMPPVFHPSSFMQPTMTSWDMHNTADRVPNQNDPMTAFLACQSQPMTMDGYTRMAALFQQMQSQPCYSGLKNN
ncbi:unnamed protein product [Lactuca virosa]|uniref:BHLH domain-containing protein n=1 Tax=Lactuca virosa TaxID=75947 RepID=A0AAU9LCK6_9ASTR|nr:unnamed protein product [Lactuca virosa]